MSFESIVPSEDGGVAPVTVNRSERLNAINRGRSLPDDLLLRGLHGFTRELSIEQRLRDLIAGRSATARRRSRNSSWRG